MQGKAGLKILVLGVFVVLAKLSIGADKPSEKPVSPSGEASSFTKEANRGLLASPHLDWLEKDDIDFAARGMICPLSELTIKNKEGQIVWSNIPYDKLFASEKSPDTVNPSLWRHERLSAKHGLYKVADNFYQVRGQDLSNISFIVAPQGYIIIDPLASAEPAASALKLVKEKLGDKPVIAVIYSHSHIDHFAGVKGVTSEVDVKAGKVQIIAPKGFTHYAVEENVLAGNAMSRRSVYMYGSLIPVGEKGQVGAGEGKAVSKGTGTLILPTKEIGDAGEKMTIGGLDLEFAFAPGEAPVGMHVYVPAYKTLYLADNCVHGIQNVYTIRGALTRNPLQWMDSVQKALTLSGTSDVEACCAGHNWPRFGKDKVKEYLANQRDALKYMNDQTLRLANMGYNGAEIENMVTLPPELANKWYLRSYYGDLRHNVRAIYTLYMGWYDGNPSNLNPLPPRREAAKMLEYMGGSDTVIQKAKQDFANGQYRWVARAMDIVMWAQPDNKEARDLAAAALEQLGYQAESATWRNAYLTGAYELRNGILKRLRSSASPDILAAMSMPMLFDFLAVKLDPQKAAGKTITLNWDLPDIKEKYTLALKNSVLNFTAGETAKADAGITVNKQDLVALIGGGDKAAELLKGGKIKVSGNADKFKELFAMFDKFGMNFSLASHEKISGE